MTAGGTSVLMYHRIAADPLYPDEAIYTVGPPAFEAQIEGILATGRPIVGLDHLLEPSFPKGAVCLTFDDGSSSDAETVLPLLSSRGIAASFFVSPARLETDSFLSWDALEGLAEAGMTVGSHGWDHTLLDDLDDAAIERQLKDSKQALEEHLKRAITALSLPGGTGASRAPRIARRLGYRLVLGSRPAVAREADREDVIPRFAIRRSDRLARVVGYASQSSLHLARASARYGLAGLLRRVAGGRLYEKGRTLLGARLSREQP